jgi:hypothetical protein
MLRKLRARLTYANVTATLALFFALAGGSAYAIDEWNGSNIQDETLTGADVEGKPGTRTVPAVNGTLTGADISGQAASRRNGTPFVEGSLTGADVFDNTLAGADITDSSLTGADVFDNTISGADITNGSLSGYNDIAFRSIDPAHLSGALNDEKLGLPFVNFLANIGTVPAQSCVDREVTGVDAQGQHLLLTPNWAGTAQHLSYEAQFRPDAGSAFIHVCNPTPDVIDDSFTRFNLLVIDAD